MFDGKNGGNVASRDVGIERDAKVPGTLTLVLDKETPTLRFEGSPGDLKIAGYSVIAITGLTFMQSRWSGVVLFPNFWARSM